jgi:aminoglycoside/choline kinase family phosphotransferase
MQNARMNKPCRNIVADERLDQAMAWSCEVLGENRLVPEPVSGDASFRRYFRFEAAGRSLILMDAPPQQEDSARFLDIGDRIRRAGLRTPEIYQFDLQKGFGLMEDFGDTLYRELIHENTPQELFDGLFDILEGFAGRVDARGLPEYAAGTLQFEMDLFTDWYLKRHRRRELSEEEQAAWTRFTSLLIESAQGQPQVFVHRDFHSCNLLKTTGGVGIIDYQDGVLGPLNYDLASLIWDRYVSWPRARLLEWMETMHRRFGLDIPLQEWVRSCDWMGLQRNLKIVGIFTRLEYRDGKRGYLAMLPRFYQYLLDVMPLYPEFDEMTWLLERSECAP